MAGKAARGIAAILLMAFGPPLTWLAILWSDPVESGIGACAPLCSCGVGIRTWAHRPLDAALAQPNQSADPTAIPDRDCPGPAIHARGLRMRGAS